MMPPFSVSTVSVLLVWLITACESQSTCSVENSLRLVGGTTQLEGRVEICQGGLWGTVCDDFWDYVNAQVTCGQLGYSRDGAEAVSQAQFGQGSGPILLDNVHCTTTDTRLADCTHDTNHNCNHGEDAGVRCQSRSCEDGEIRLANGLHEYEGRVEVCLNREWGTVCDDNWNNNDAAVVCTQLGYSRYNAQSYSTAHFGQGTGSILLDDVACSGQESKLINCTYDPVTADCTHSEDAGVRCSTDVTCQDGNVRLIGGDGGNEGRVEVCLNEQWGTVCNDLWSVEDAQVVCSQLGFSKQGVTVIEFATPGTGLISLDNVECAGTEARLIDCLYDSHTADCTHAEDAGVRCVVLCTNGNIRLVGGTTGHEGRVEVCWNETWGSVCDSRWSVEDATVVCRQLDFSQEAATPFTDVHFGVGTGPILLNNLECTGSEGSLVNCSHGGVGNTSSCTHTNDAGVRCQPKICNDSAVKLVGGLTGFEGRLEVCWNQQWGTVCDDFFNEVDAHVVCTQLGYTPTASVTSFGSAYFGSGTGLILLDDVECVGTETSLRQCNSRGFGVHNCYHGEDVGLRCAQCIEASVRLVGGRDGNEGRVEVCLGGGWGTVCDDGWSQEDAAVVCRQLELPTENARATYGASYGRGDGLPILMDNVSCISSETQLNACPYLNAHNLRSCADDHSEDAGVICELLPSVAPNIGSVTRISATQIQLQWAPLSVEDIHGTLTSYLVRYRVVESRVRRNIDDSAVVVEVSGTDTIIDGLEPHLTYGVSVAARTARGIGNYSKEMIAGLFENSPFQLHMFGAIVCLPWTEAGLAEKMISIIEELSLNVQDMCTCDFSSKYIAQREVLCGNLSTDRVIFHGTFISTANNTGTQFRDQLQQWVYSEPTIIVQGVQLTVVPCSVNVEESCVPAPEISTPTSVITISATTIADVVGISLPLIGGVAGGGVLLICGVFTLILIMVCLKTKLKTKERYNVRRHLNALTLQTSSPFASSSNRAPSKTNEVELQDCKIYKDENVYEDPSNFEFFSSHQIQPPPLPPNLNNTASSQINFNTLKHETDIDKTYSEVDVPTHETFNTFCRDVHTNRKPVGEKEAYSQLDVNAMPRLHYGNIGASAIIPNDYHYPTISGPFKSENATYSELLPDPLPSSADQHAASSKDKCAERSQQSNYEPLLPPPRGTKARDIPCTEYQSLGPPVGYAVPSSLRNTSELKIDDAQTRNGPLQGNSDVPQPGLGDCNGADRKPQGCEIPDDDIQIPDDYVDISSPSLQ